MTTDGAFSPRSREPREVRTRRAVAVAGVGVVWSAFLAFVGLLPLAAIAVLAAVVGALWILGGHPPREVADRVRRALGAVRPLANRAGRWHHRVAGSAVTATRRLRKPEPVSASRLARQSAQLRRDGRINEAVEVAEEAVTRFRSAGDVRGRALAFNSLGIALTQAGRHADAIHAFDTALALLAESGDTHHEGQVLANLGTVHLRVGGTEAARFCWGKALERLEPGSPESERTAELLGVS